jgi:hypothetical protein
MLAARPRRPRVPPRLGEVAACLFVPALACSDRLDADFSDLRLAPGLAAGDTFLRSRPTGVADAVSVAT